MLVLYAFAAEIRHIAVDIRQRDGTQKRQVNVTNIYSVQWFVRQRRIADLLHVAEEIPHIQVVFVHRSLGVRFDGLMITEKIKQQLWRVQAIVHSVCFERSRLWSASRSAAVYHGNDTAESRPQRAGTVIG